MTNKPVSLTSKNHWAVAINNASNKFQLLDLLANGPVPPEFEELRGLQGALFSKLELVRFIDEEERHGAKTLTKDTPQSLKSMSTGEQKKALLKYILAADPDFIVLDNPFDNLDNESQAQLAKSLQEISKHTQLVQIISRKTDLLPFVTRFVTLDRAVLKTFGSISELEHFLATPSKPIFQENIPKPLNTDRFEDEVLIDLKNIAISYDGKPILKNINWKIRPGSFWQLVGKNGSGKTTLLSMITGENSKGYGQDLYIFGKKKGSGESIWDIKKRIGYFTPSMIDKFTGHHSAINMLISGLTDSVGLYLRPTEVQLQLAKEWLELINMWGLKDVYFHDLSMGQQRLLMTVRAMVKHPLLLILDEPTAGLDDKSAALFVALANKIAQESKTAIIFVSHRKEPGLRPQYVFQLEQTKHGSTGKIIKTSQNK
ncbi:ATP-binding cassette domain-containing protein [Flavobacteriaceae bacterium F89]|uniref:ATP-binding cassette domain-containing protein n=1 Tax=Cerina litoralis TaxID=2874477 RepID=A0AAE3ERG7_9FLAO|nr:ATP-binding cassette domain-containing protein [Cerina litoralis]MCG2459740.1 ATP-binding cassette domain-containing protein [Cerina litoralis]